MQTVDELVRRFIRRLNLRAYVPQFKGVSANVKGYENDSVWRGSGDYNSEWPAFNPDKNEIGCVYWGFEHSPNPRECNYEKKDELRLHRVLYKILADELGIGDEMVSTETHKQVSQIVNEHFDDLDEDIKNRAPEDAIGKDVPRDLEGWTESVRLLISELEYESVTDKEETATEVIQKLIITVCSTSPGRSHGFGSGGWLNISKEDDWEDKSEIYEIKDAVTGNVRSDFEGNFPELQGDNKEEFWEKFRNCKNVIHKIALSSSPYDDWDRFNLLDGYNYGPEPGSRIFAAVGGNLLGLGFTVGEYEYDSDRLDTPGHNKHSQDVWWVLDLKSHPNKISDNEYSIGSYSTVREKTLEIGEDARIAIEEKQEGWQRLAVFTELSQLAEKDEASTKKVIRYFCEWEREYDYINRLIEEGKGGDRISEIIQNCIDNIDVINDLYRDDGEIAELSFHPVNSTEIKQMEAER